VTTEDGIFITPLRDLMAKMAVSGAQSLDAAPNLAALVLQAVNIKMSRLPSATLVKHAVIELGLVTRFSIARLTKGVSLVAVCYVLLMLLFSFIIVSDSSESMGRQNIGARRT
jgi:hypothetical protein